MSGDPLQVWALTTARQAEDADGDPVPGVWELGSLDGDGNFYPVVEIDTGNYDQPEAAEPLARAILARVGPVAGWQPIESAPKDGTHILACGGHYDTHTGFNQNPPTVAHWFGYPDPGGFYLSHSEGEPMSPFPAKWWLPGAFGETPATPTGKAP